MKISIKNILLAIVLIVLPVIQCSAQTKSADKNSTTERVFVLTDRTSYLAGESIWTSLFCFDVSKPKGTLSGLSSVAYLELISENGLSASAKIHLNNGRGSGRIALLPSLPTGNYKLIAYTKQMRNEEVLNYSEKLITIFNTLTTERVKGNVNIAKSNSVLAESDFLPANSSKIDIKAEASASVNHTYPISFINKCDKKMSVAVSISRIDNLPENSNESFATFLATKEWNKMADLKGGFIPEYEGEVIEGNVKYDKSATYLQYIAYLSAVGVEPNVYSTYVDSTGQIVFYTNSIFGDREIVLEIPSADTTSSCTFEIKDAFARPNVGEFPKLLLTPSYELALNERSIEMQLGRRFGADTLFERIKLRKDPLLNVMPKVYMLDDYTRFPVMSEVMVEYIPELRFRKVDKLIDLQVRWTDAFSSITFSKASTLPLIDGIPIFKHQKIYDYDPLKVKSISIYGGQYFMGAAKYDGIVMFNTYKNDYPGLKFNKNAKIMDFMGVQYPCGFSANKVVDRDNLPDLRSLLYWNPQVDLKIGEDAEYKFHTSGIGGKFLIKVEGVTEDGEPVFYSKVIEIK